MRLHRVVAAAACMLAAVLAYANISGSAQTYKRMVVREAVEKIDNNKWVDSAFTISPDGRHLGMLAVKDGDRSFVLDGKHEPWFTYIEEGTIVFSPDGNHHAYVAFLKNYQIVMLDGVPQKKYPRLVADKPVFSPDMSHVGYVAVDERGEFAVNGDVEGPVFSKIDTSQMLYGPDGRFYYVAADGDERVLMAGGEEYYRAKFIAGLRLGGDGKHMAFTAGDGSSWRVVVDGAAQPKKYDFIDADSVTLKPDGTPVYVVASGRVRSVVDGDTEEPVYGAAIKDTLKVSPDGSMVAYGVISDDGQHIIVNGIKGSSFDRVGPPVFSPDGKRFAYTAGKGKDWYVVVDGDAQGPYMGLSMTSLVFSPDSKHFAYSARVGKLKWAVFLNGAEYKRVEGVSGPPEFGPWSRRLAFVGVISNTQSVYINGEPSEKYDAVVTWGGGRVWFGDKGEVRYFAVDKRVIYYVEEWPEPDIK